MMERNLFQRAILLAALCAAAMLPTRLGALNSYSPTTAFAPTTTYGLDAVAPSASFTIRYGRFHC